MGLLLLYGQPNVMAATIKRLNWKESDLSPCVRGRYEKCSSAGGVELVGQYGYMSDSLEGNLWMKGTGHF